MLRIAERRLSGRLLLTSDLGERTVYLHSGYPVFALSSQFSERLGAVGVRYGMLKREDVASALNLAREQGCEIGRALLELGSVNGSQLFRMLGAQLIEQLAASCGSSPARARFVADLDALSKVAILRVHPMTAVLATVRHMPNVEHTKMLNAVAERKIAQLPMPEPARQWLTDLGYLGDAATLAGGDDTTVAIVHARLIAKLRATTQEDFDPSASPVPLDVRKEDSNRPAARSVADYVMLTLLLSGAIKLVDVASESDVRGDSLPNSADGVRASLGGALRVPLSDIPEAHGNENVREVDLAIAAYLETKREARAAARLAIWGPAAEIGDDEALNQLLTLYLTLKPEAKDAAVLDVRVSDPPPKVATAHATYREFLEKLGSSLDSPLARARIAELTERIDDAFRALAPDLAPPSAPPAAVGGQAHEGATKSRAPNAPSGEPRTSASPEADGDTLLRSVEARVREGRWQKVVELIEPQRKGKTLPPTLGLALALAQRELAPKPALRSKRLIFYAFVIGTLLGFAIRHFSAPVDLQQQLQELLLP